ncbi:hypothetical protein DFR31_0884 [Alkalispirillum mobile]|uniref:Uncharacterized protein n=1 Tax=Alkalispirillum mobile TaxID=85925 RepID=A0A498C5P9_9GAMM|nr:hypothetical protein [Alkalispirillum mobile]RLK50972.1 hypothetical protein DFR31_0884 [Alkalispirillum mobile]
MSDDKTVRQQLLRTLSRSVAYTVPVLAIVGGSAGIHAIMSDAVADSGYQMMAAAEAAGEAEAEGEGEGEAEGEGEGEGEAEGEGGY